MLPSSVQRYPLSLGPSPAFLHPAPGYFSVTPGHETLTSSFFSPRPHPGYRCFPPGYTHIFSHLARWESSYAGNCIGSVTAGGARHTCTHPHLRLYLYLCTCTRTYTRTRTGGLKLRVSLPGKEAKLVATANTFGQPGAPHQRNEGAWEQRAQQEVTGQCREAMIAARPGTGPCAGLIAKY